MSRQITASTCCYCGVGCGVLIEHDGERILGVSGDPAHPANFGKLCSKGSTLHLTGDLNARALYPQLRLGKALARGRTDWAAPWITRPTCSPPPSPNTAPTAWRFISRGSC